jgi:hypothetical protein
MPPLHNLALPLQDGTLLLLLLLLRGLLVLLERDRAV